MPEYILGLSAFYHDSAACLLKDGEIAAAVQEERFTRKKHDASFPAHAIRACLKEAGITGQDLKAVAFYDKPFLKFERILFTYLRYAPSGVRSFCKAVPLWLKQKLYIKDRIAEDLGFSGPIYFPEHHESHAASAFFPSPFRDAAVLTMDGVGEWATTSFGVGEGCRVRLLKEIRFPHSLGLLYSAFTYYTGFRVNSGEYKMMGLAPYGEPKYADRIRGELIDIKDDGSFKLNMTYFNYCAGLTMVNRRFENLFGGPARRPESPLTQKDMDIARSIQEVTEEMVLKMARHVREATGKDHLCLAGGVALNCVANGRILREGLFKKIWIQPAAGDAGGALGAAMIVRHHVFNKDRCPDGQHDSQKGSYLGPDYHDEIEFFAKSAEVNCEQCAPNDLPQKVAALIADQKVVGLFQGRMEFGPRALGGRSILGDARSERMQSVMNLKIKFRESFRPFAPSVLREKAGAYFDCEGDSPYMLLVARVKEEKLLPEARRSRAEGLDRLKIRRSVIPAVTHVDETARLQTVDQDTNPFYYQIIREFEKLTGCPVIINTSFNVRGEPIVCTPEDAYRCFMCTNMDVLVMGPYIFDKTLQPGRDKYQLEDISRILD